METIRLYAKNFTRYFDVTYFKRFILILLAFYYANVLFIAIANPQGPLYNAFMYENLHYANWLRASILETANVFAHFLGLDSYIADPKIIAVENGRSLLMARQCLGLEIMGFWAAFVLAHKATWKKKLAWTVGGMFVIWFINCWRVSILLYALENNWQALKKINHHDAFNYIAYGIVVLMIIMYNRQEKVAKV